jgi:hypothetical protein
VASALGEPEPARHELPEIDAAALLAGAAAERAWRAADSLGLERWIRYLGPLPDLLRDGSLREVRLAARTARAAYGPKDSIRDSLPEDVTEPLLAAVDRLLKAVARYEAHR